MKQEPTMRLVASGGALNLNMALLIAAIFLAYVDGLQMPVVPWNPVLSPEPFPMLRATTIDIWTMRESARQKYIGV